MMFSISVLSQHRLTVKADDAFEKGYWSAAIENYKLALKKEKDAEEKLRIIYNLAQSYSGAKEYKNSVTWFKKVRRRKNFLKDHPDILLKIADSIPTVPLTVIQTSISLIIDIVLILVSAEMI